MTAKEIINEMPRFSANVVRSKTVKVHMRGGLVLFGQFISLDHIIANSRTNTWLFECVGMPIPLDGHNITLIEPFVL